MALGYDRDRSVMATTVAAGTLLQPLPQARLFDVVLQELQDLDGPPAPAATGRCEA